MIANKIAIVTVALIAQTATATSKGRSLDSGTLLAVTTDTGQLQFKTQLNLLSSPREQT